MKLLTTSSVEYENAITAKITKTVTGDKLESDSETKLLTKITKKNDGIFDLQLNFNNFSGGGTYEATFFITKYYIQQASSLNIAMRNQTLALEITKIATTSPSILGSTERISNSA